MPSKHAGTPLPWRQELTPYYKRGATFLQGQVIMIVGPPASAKSAHAMYMLDLWDLPSLYICADMAQQTAVSRLGALRTSYSVEQVAHHLLTESDASAFIADELSSSKISFAFDDAPRLSDIEDEIAAYVELYDEYPNVLAVDNLVDLDLSEISENQYEAWKQGMLFFKGLAREYGITVLVLHHARELGKPDYPAARRDISGKVSETPELTISVALDEDGTFRTAVVKNRTGAQSAMATSGDAWRAHIDKMAFTSIGPFVKEAGK